MNLTLEKTGRILAGMLFPAVCPICGEKLPFIMSAQERQLVHPECEKKLRMILSIINYLQIRTII